MYTKYFQRFLLLTLLVAPKQQAAFFEIEDLKDYAYDWKPWAIGATCVAAGCCLYKYFNERPQAVDPETYKQYTETAYQAVQKKNDLIFKLYNESQAQASEDLINALRERGSKCASIKSDYTYLGERCRRHAPLLRGCEILLHERDVLLQYRNEIIRFYESEEIARQEYRNLDNLLTLSQQLEVVYRLAKKHMLYHISQDNFQIFLTLNAKHPAFCC